MKPPLTLTERDQTLLKALVLRVRLFSQRQIMDHWFGDVANTRRRLNRLAQHDWLQRDTVLARPTPALQTPLVSWKPGQAVPNAAHVAWQCQNRWRKRPVRQCVVWIATEKASRTFGGTGRGSLKHRTQATHDLGVAAVWLRFRGLSPPLAEKWQGEDLLAWTRRGEKLPDAFLVNSNGGIDWVIEFGGDYDASRVTAFHQDCASRNLPYQLW